MNQRICVQTQKDCCCCSCVVSDEQREILWVVYWPWKDIPNYLADSDLCFARISKWAININRCDYAAYIKRYECFHLLLGRESVEGLMYWPPLARLRLLLDARALLLLLPPATKDCCGVVTALDAAAAEAVWPDWTSTGFLERWRPLLMCLSQYFWSGTASLEHRHFFPSVLRHLPGSGSMLPPAKPRWKVPHPTAQSQRRTLINHC